MVTSVVLAPLLWVCLSTVAEATVQSLATALNERNLFMKDVAGSKFMNKRPVEDKPREIEVMNDAVANASKAGLNADSVRPFIQAQMDVAKAIQQAFIDGWNKTPEPDFKPRPLDKVREDILKKDSDIIQSIHDQLKAGGFKETDRQTIYAALTAPKLTDDLRKLLVDSLFKIKLQTAP